MENGFNAAIRGCVEKEYVRLFTEELEGMTDEEYMRQALEEARRAYAEDEVPIGCVIVDPQKETIIAESYNLSQHVEDATAHAEIKAIQNACLKTGSNRLRGMDMYVTLEPCCHYGKQPPAITNRRSVRESWQKNAAGC